MDWIKKHWKEVLLGLLIVFSLNKCTVACNRDTTINNQKIELVQKDSLIKAQADSLNIMNIRWNDAQNSKLDLKDVALGNKEELSNQIANLQKDKDNLTLQVNNLTNENNKLKKEIISLKKQINEQ